MDAHYLLIERLIKSLKMLAGDQEYHERDDDAETERADQVDASIYLVNFASL